MLANLNLACSFFVFQTFDLWFLKSNPVRYAFIFLCPGAFQLDIADLDPSILASWFHTLLSAFAHQVCIWLWHPLQIRYNLWPLHRKLGLMTTRSNTEMLFTQNHFYFCWTYANLNTFHHFFLYCFCLWIV